MMRKSAETLAVTMACYPSRNIHADPTHDAHAPQAAMGVTPTRIEVRSERATYPVLIGAGLSASLGRLLSDHRITGQRLVVSSARIWRLQSSRLKQVLAPNDRP